LVGNQQQLAFGVVNECRDDVLIVFHVHDYADRLAMTAPAGQPIRADSVELAAGREDQDLVRCLRVEGKLECIAFLEGQRRVIGKMAFHRAQPSLFRDDDSNRLPLDHCLVNLGQIVLRSLRKLGAAPAQFGLGTELFAQFADLPFDRPPLFRLGAKQRLYLLLLLRQRVKLLAYLKFFELAQRAQPHVENGLGLDIGQFPSRHHDRLRLILFANDADHLVNVQIGDEIAVQNLKSALNLCETVSGAADQHVAAVVEPFLKRFLQREDVRHLAARKHVHVEGEPALQLRQLEQRFHQQTRINSPALGRADDADLLRAFVPYVLQERQLARQKKLCDLFDEPRLLHAVGNFRDDDNPGSPALIFLVPLRPDAKTAAPCFIGFENGSSAVHDDAAGRRSEEHTSELQSRENLVCRLLLEKKKNEKIE